MEQTPPAVEEKIDELQEYRLFFPGDDGLLHAQRRELPVSPESTQTIVHLVETLLAGPNGEHSSKEIAVEPVEPEAASEAVPDTSVPIRLEAVVGVDGLWPPFPSGIALKGTYFMNDDTVVLDLVSEDGARVAAGSRIEMLTLFSLVNTVLLNIDEAKRLIVLWNGRQSNTFAGHIDTTRPLAANTDLIASGGTS